MIQKDINYKKEKNKSPNKFEQRDLICEHGNNQDRYNDKNNDNNILFEYWNDDSNIRNKIKNLLIEQVFFQKYSGKNTRYQKNFLRKLK